MLVFERAGGRRRPTSPPLHAGPPKRIGNVGAAWDVEPVGSTCDGRHTHIGAQMGRNVLRHSGPGPPGAQGGDYDGHEATLVHGIGDREFEAQHNSVLGKSFIGHDDSGRVETRSGPFGWGKKSRRNQDARRPGFDPFIARLCWKVSAAEGRESIKDEGSTSGETPFAKTEMEYRHDNHAAPPLGSLCWTHVL